MKFVYLKRTLSLLLGALMLTTCAVGMVTSAAAKDVNLHSGTGSRHG